MKNLWLVGRPFQAVLLARTNPLGRHFVTPPFPSWMDQQNVLRAKEEPGKDEKC